MKKYRKILSIMTAASLTTAFPMQALAKSPDFAHDEATWARMQDNVMEYDELPLLVEEYNPLYQNNQATYQDTRTDDDAQAVRQNLYENAMDAYDSADNLRSQAEDLLDLNMPAAYAGLIAAAISTENSALKAEQSAQNSYTDSEMKRLDHMQNQAALVIQTQGLFASYNQTLKALENVKKNIEKQEFAYRSVEAKVNAGMATQIELLTERKNLQSMQSAYTDTQGSLESIRQQLCLMTGWKYNDQPEIRDTPSADLTRITLMNPEVDKQTALYNNYSLKSNKRAYANMSDNSTDKKNMDRTIKNQEEKIKAGVQSLYNDVLQKKTALELAEATLATEATKMSAMETKLSIGTVSQLEYLQEQVEFSGKQIERETADMALFQAMETYDWALKGYMSLQ